MNDSPGQTPSRQDARGEDDRPAGVSVAAILALLLRHRRPLVVLPLVGAVVWVAVALVLPREYTSEAMFTPSSGTAQISQLAGIAAQFGVNVPQGATNESPAFYSDLMQSKGVLRAAVVTNYRFPTSLDSGADTLSGNLVRLLDVGGADSAAQVSKAIDKVRDLISISTDATTGLVTLDVQTHWAGLSRSLAQRLLDLVNAFNVETRQTQASAERRFLETRVEAVHDSLRAAEDSMQSFLIHNRSYQNSPELQFQYERLERRLTLQQQVYTTLTQSLEQAKIDQVRNTPVVTVVEPPEAPARSDRRHLLVKALLGLVLGGVVALVWAFASEWARWAPQEEPEEYRELERQWVEARRDLQAIWRRIRRQGKR